MAHPDIHSDNVFCGEAGLFEMKHLDWLLEQLSDAELIELINAGGISFGDRDMTTIDRDSLEGVVDEIDREVFYEHWHRLKTPPTTR